LLNLFTSEGKTQMRSKTGESITKIKNGKKANKLK
jgi:hypothetical protein